MTRNVTGFYHDPPLWLVESPVERTTAGVGQVLFDRLDHEVLQRTDLAGGLALRATVEGLFAFDFSNMPNYTISDGPNTDFEIVAERYVQRTRIMNAYLAFFYTQQVSVDKWSQARMVVTPELAIPMSNTGQGFGNQRVAHLALSRIPSTYSPAMPGPFDSRINMRGQPISLAVVQNAADDLSALISTHGDDGVMLVDLYLRATKAFQDHNHSLCVITAWAIVERIINDLWKNLIADNTTRNGVSFIQGARRDRLKDGRTFTASVMSEMLSFQNYISKEIYDDISAVRKIRNDWMHSLKPVGVQDAVLANSVCQRLLEQVKGLTVIGATGLTIHG